MRAAPGEGLLEDWGRQGYLLLGLEMSLLVPQVATVRICKRHSCAGELLSCEPTCTRAQQISPISVAIGCQAVDRHLTREHADE